MNELGHEIPWEFVEYESFENNLWGTGLFVFIDSKLVEDDLIS